MRKNTIVREEKRDSKGTKSDENYNQTGTMTSQIKSWSLVKNQLT
jgi:hypothetical protein